MEFETFKENSPPQRKEKYEYLESLRGMRYGEELRRLLLKDPEFLPTLKQLQVAYRDAEEIWENDVRGKARYELINQDYIVKLAKHLSERIKSHKGEKKPLCILEIGAGDGRLSHFLKEEILHSGHKEGVDFTLCTTDSFGWGIKPEYSVLKMKDENAVWKFKPEVVFASWLPGNSFDKHNQRPNPNDSLDFVRGANSVQEYILIGDPKTTITEAELKSHFGFQVSELKELSVLQACRNDDPKDIGRGHSQSKTFSFVRNKRAR